MRPAKPACATDPEAPARQRLAGLRRKTKARGYPRRASEAAGTLDFLLLVIFFYLFLFGYRYCPCLSTGIHIRLKSGDGYESHPQLGWAIGAPHDSTRQAWRRDC